VTLPAAQRTTLDIAVFVVETTGSHPAIVAGFSCRGAPVVFLGSVRDRRLGEIVLELDRCLDA
jgi:molybdopterin synthase catalytic subunit